MVKNMRNFVLFGFYFVSVLSLKEVFAESENEIKRGIYPFMAIVYYTDESVVLPSGARFIRNAVLIRPEWLISSSLETNDTQLAFPRKTLLARVGAISLDTNFTLNEDEDEQEREIIQVVRPANFSSSHWWYNDVTLLKTLMPFNMTNAVGATPLSPKRDNIDKTCNMLLFVNKYANSSDEKILIQMAVDLMPPSKENCGIYFRNETTICASDSDENKIVGLESDFCYGNAGGPLICDGDVIGLQTYIGNNCKQPYLYQLLSAWDDFISCGVEEKCILPECTNICEDIDKDVVMAVETNKDIIISSSETPKLLVMDMPSEDSSDEENPTLPETTKAKLMINESENHTPTASSIVQITPRKETTPLAITENEEKSTMTINVASWPKERSEVHRKKLDEADDSDKIERQTDMEAQRQEVKKKAHSAAENIGFTAPYRSLSFGVLFLTLYYLI